MLDKDPTGRPPAMKIVARELRLVLRKLREARAAKPLGAAEARVAACQECGRSQSANG